MNIIKKWIVKRRLEKLADIERRLNDMEGNNAKPGDLKNLSVKGDYITKDTSFTLLYLILVGIVIIVAMTIFYEHKFGQLNEDFDAKVDELKKTYESLSEKEKAFNETKQLLTVKESREETLEDQYQGVLAEKESLRTERAKLIDENAKLKADLVSATDQIANLKARIKDLEERIEELENALAELRRTLILIKLFNSSIDSILVFIGFTLLFVLIKIPWYYAAIPFLLHAIIYIPRKMKDIRYSEVEKKVPILKEKLRTVADNVGKSNELIDELNKEVLREMKQIKTSAFIDPRKSMFKMFALGLMAFLIIFSASLNVKFFDFDSILKKRAGSDGGIRNLEDIDIDSRSILEEDIYGEQSIAELGNQEVVFSMDSFSGEIDLNREKEIDTINFATSYPKEIYATSDSSYKEKIAKEDEDVVKTYFDQITRASQ